MPKMVECIGDVIDETPLAWKFVVTGTDESDHVWVPKSLGTWEPDEEGELSTSGSMSVPEWFAHKEGLS